MARNKNDMYDTIKDIAGYLKLDTKPRYNKNGTFKNHVLTILRNKDNYGGDMLILIVLDKDGSKLFPFGSTPRFEKDFNTFLEGMHSGLLVSKMSKTQLEGMF